MLTIRRISTSADCLAVKTLVLDFVAWAGTQDPDAQTATTFADLDAELNSLPGIFGPPTGCFLLARQDDDPAGCVAFRELDAQTVELKRMWVRPDQRGGGVGLKLVQTLIAVARAQGRKRIELSSYHTMTGAHKIYRAVGFQEFAAPADLPAKDLGRVIFMQMAL